MLVAIHTLWARCHSSSHIWERILRKPSPKWSIGRAVFCSDNAVTDHAKRSQKIWGRRRRKHRRTVSACLCLGWCLMVPLIITQKSDFLSSQLTMSQKHPFEVRILGQKDGGTSTTLRSQSDMAAQLINTECKLCIELFITFIFIFCFLYHWKIILTVLLQLLPVYPHIYIYVFMPKLSCGLSLLAWIGY